MEEEEKEGYEIRGEQGQNRTSNPSQFGAGSG